MGRAYTGENTMSTTTTRLTYYNGMMWHSVRLPDGTRAVWPSGIDGRPLPGAATRYYRGHARVSGAAQRQPALAVSGG